MSDNAASPALEDLARDPEQLPSQKAENRVALSSNPVPGPGKSNSESFVQREPRYSVGSAHKASVIVERTAGSGRESIVGKLFDLSRGGAKLSVPCCIPFEEKLSLTIQIPDVDFEVKVSAEVCWSRQGNDDSWVIGCSFDPKFPEDALTKMAEEGFLDRRQNQRYPVDISTTICWELAKASIRVRLRDISAGGFRIECKEFRESGQRLLMHVENPDGSSASIPAQVQWRIAIDRGFMIGCALLDPDDFHILRGASIMAEASRQVEEFSKRNRPKWVKPALIGVSLFIFAYSLLIPMLPTPTAPQPVPPPPSQSAPASTTINDPKATSNTKPNTAPIADLLSEVADPPSEQPPSAEPRSGLPTTDGTTARLEAQQERLRTLALEAQRLRRSVPKAAHGRESADESPKRPEVQPPTDASTQPLRNENRPTRRTPKTIQPLSERQKRPIEPRLARTSFERGQRLYQQGKYAPAADAFRVAIDHDPNRPMYVYLLALTQYQQRELKLAEANVRKAAQLEALNPISEWGRTMQRYQGAIRVWLETIRRQERQRR